MTPRTLVYRTLEFDHPQRIPRQLWTLPWAISHYPEAYAQIQQSFPDDIVHSNVIFKDAPRTNGEPYKAGFYTDEWGCTFENKQDGIFGEVKQPLLSTWAGLNDLKPPRERLSVDIPHIFFPATKDHLYNTPTIYGVNNCMDKTKHNELIIDQFTKQAIPFSQKIAAHANEVAFKLIIETSEISKDDTVLDVACGPGLLTNAVSKTAKHVTGIDLVPAMLEQARLLQKEKNLSNLTWDSGDVTSLPYADSSFSRVVTRLSFHHFLDPKIVLKEMVRVAKPHGKIIVVDRFTDSDAQTRLHDNVESLRDPSTTRTLPLMELKSMFREAGFTSQVEKFYRMEIELEQQLKASFPKAGDAEKFRQLITDDVGKDAIGMGAYRKGKDIYLSSRIAILVGTKQ